MKNIDACVFDAYGTLFDVGSAAQKCRDQLAGKADDLATLWRTKQLEYTWLRSLMGEYRDFWQVTGDGLDFAMESLGFDDPALRERLINLYLQLDAYPEVPDMLRRLNEAGIGAAILSNGSPDMLASATANAGIGKYLSHVLSVDGLKVYKPHPTVYQLAVDALDVEPERICFMSSNAWDVAGAANFGFRVNWVNRFGHKSERLPGVPENQIKTLAELPELLGLK